MSPCIACHWPPPANFIGGASATAFTIATRSARTPVGHDSRKTAGGGQWQAMHGDMAGYYEARPRGPRKRLYRLFGILERDASGLPGPSLVIITGMDKPNESAFSEADYRRVRRLGDEYRGRTPRSIEK
jgi:hypothetical protein